MERREQHGQQQADNQRWPVFVQIMLTAAEAERIQRLINEAQRLDN